MTKILILISIALLLTGCGKTVSSPIGGPYFVEAEQNGAPLVEPGGGAVNSRLVYRANGKTVVICKNPGPYYFDDEDRSFSSRVYGNNLAYTWYDPKTDANSLIVYSPATGNITIDANYRQYWKVVANDQGITCHRLQNGKEANDPNPKVYSASYLKGL